MDKEEKKPITGTVFPSGYDSWNKDNYQEIKFEMKITVPKGEHCNLCSYLTYKDELTIRGVKQYAYCEAFRTYLLKTDGEYSCCQNYDKCLKCMIRCQLPKDKANEVVDLIDETLTNAVKDIIKNSSESDKK